MSSHKIDKIVIEQVVPKLVAAAHPSKIILFGSYARDDADEQSDIDLLVIEDNVVNKGKEMVRLRNSIGNIGLGVDLLIYSTEEIDQWGHLPGTALYKGLKEGKIIYEAPN